MTHYEITDEGLAHINRVLVERHKLFSKRPPSSSELTAWACAAIDEMYNGSDRPYFEFRPCESITGHTELHELSPQHYTTINTEDA